MFHSFETSTSALTVFRAGRAEIGYNAIESRQEGGARQGSIRNFLCGELRAMVLAIRCRVLPPFRLRVALVVAGAACKSGGANNLVNRRSPTDSAV
jgi:hypothetical protein